MSTFTNLTRADSGQKAIVSAAELQHAERFFEDCNLNSGESDTGSHETAVVLSGVQRSCYPTPDSMVSMEASPSNKTNNVSVYE